MRKIKSCAVKVKNYKAFLNENLTNAAASEKDIIGQADAIINPLDGWTKKVMAELLSDDNWGAWEHDDQFGISRMKCDSGADIIGKNIGEFLKYAPTELKDEVIRQFISFERETYETVAALPSAILQALVKKDSVSDSMKEEIRKHSDDGGCFIQ